MSRKWSQPKIKTAGKALRVVLALAIMLQTFAPLVPTGPVGRLPVAEAASVTSASFSGGTGTYKDTSVTPNVLYVKSGTSLTLTVNTDSNTKCVEVAGAHTATQTSETKKDTWTFTFTAGTGDGVKTVTTKAYKNFNQSNCTKDNGEEFGLQTASYTLDNTGPTLLPSDANKTGVSPAPNAAGWHKGNVTITWSAADQTGIGTGPTPATDSVTTSGTVTKTATATDRLGNSGSGSVTIKLDKDAPTITGTRSPAANTAGWNKTDVTASFTCTDALSGIKSCTGATSVTASQTVTGTAVDNADNSAGATVEVKIDKVAPTLTGAPTTPPNAAGWYKGDVAIAWSCSDALSGIDGACPANNTISSEGTGLTATASVSDKAGNTTNATSSAVKIDKTAPNTTATAPANWNNTDVTVRLNASDALSGVAATYYTLDDGAQQSGNSVAISAEGVHTLRFWSVDVAGNAEAAKNVTVKIDKTKPTINHTQSPAANANGWNSTAVTVTFTCADEGGSGIASCTAPQTVTSEGKDQRVTGTATDNAGNTATDPATVNIDTTKPTITAAVDRPANNAGWYKDDVTVSFTCDDNLSGVVTCPQAQTLGEGANKSAGAEVSDAAGNTASGGVSGINVDKTPPTLTGAPSTTGWSKGDVTVTWSCTETLSGLAGQCPGTSTVTGEGDNLSASASVSDKAGNTANATVSGIKIDRTAPSTTAALDREPLKSGWYDRAVTVTLTGVDSLAGVAKTSYTVDGGDVKAYAGPFSVSGGGQHTVVFWSEDNAGNVEDRTSDGHSIAFKIDNIAPSTGASTTPATANGTNEWFTGKVEITLTAGDAESGVAATYYSVDGGSQQTYSGPFVFDQTGSHTITFWSVDNAGNVEDKTADGHSITVRFDNAPPTIAEAARTPKANADGWNNGEVTISFTCSDAESGTSTASCPDVTVASEGAGQTTKGVAVDNAGNKATVDVTGINIDLTKPTLSGAPTTPATAGWYKGDVTIRWTGSDSLSGIDATSQPADSVIRGEGSDLGAGPVTIKDKAGNVSEPASVSGIKIDRTPPTIDGEATTQPNGAGWYKGAVTVHFTCADPKLADGTTGSGVAACPTDKVLNSDGANQSVTSDPATDIAGNRSTGKTVGGINIDSQAPQTTADNQCDAKNGWCKGQTATVVLTATDQRGLSGVKEIRYSVNGNPEKVATGATVNVTVPLEAKSGTATVEFYAVDNAGNTEPKGGVSLKYDNIAPTVTHTVNPTPNAAGWNKADFSVHFDAKDDDGGSGVDAATVTKDVIVSTETAGQMINGEALDLAGNKGTDSVTVKLDKTLPTISGAATTSPTNGWYNEPVTVKFTCGDSLAGIATCTGGTTGVTVATNGANVEVPGTATDNAGNTASTTVKVNIDTGKPTITVTDGTTTSPPLQDGQTYSLALYTLGAVPQLSCSGSDSLSGAGSCSGSPSGGTANGVGKFTYTATVTDQAGNRATVTVTYQVKYKWEGFQQPINDTAHQIGTSTSIFKGGSTVPAKFQLKKADGTVVQANSLPQWLTPAKGSATSAPVDESVYSDPATSGTAYRWDATSQQYIYNWSTKGSSAGFYYRIGVTLDDGQTYYVNIGLR